MASLGGKIDDDSTGDTLRAYRVTADARGGDIINIEEATNINRDEEHRMVEGRPRDLVTVLLLKCVNNQDDHLSAYNKHEDRR